MIKYDSSGNVLWSKQMGGAGDDAPEALALDSQGNVYMAGVTDSDLFGNNLGPGDGFVVKFDPNGNQIWGKQFGTSAEDYVKDMTIDGQDNVYLVGLTQGSLFGVNAGPSAAGMTGDAFLVKYDSSGNQLWGKQFGVQGDDEANGVAVDGQGDVYVTGTTIGSLFGTSLGDDDMFLTKFAPDGAQAWGRQFGTSDADEGNSICVDGNGNAYVAGNANLSLTGAAYDTSVGYIAKYDPNGSQVWVRQVTADASVTIGNVVAGSAGTLYVAGSTGGSLFGPSAGGDDIFVMALDSGGNTIWGKQYGTSDADEPNGLSVDSVGNLYVAGDTAGSLFGTETAGKELFNTDAFVQKMGPAGQMARAPNRRLSSPRKSLLFAWGGLATNLLYPPLLLQGKPFFYAGYLCSGLPGAKVVNDKSTGFAVLTRNRQVLLRPGAKAYRLDGKTRQMSAKAVLVDGNCYVPLDVMQAVLPFPVRYDAKARTVRFDPTRPKQARRQ